jgi:hypothetical protein
MLSPAVLRVIQVFSSFMMLSLTCVFVRVLWSSIRRDVSWPWWGSMLWFEQWLKWWRSLISSWHVVLESTKYWMLGVDTSGQYVPPRVRYGMTCLLIRNVIGCVSCSVEWGLATLFVSYFVKRLNHTVQKGPLLGILSTTSGAFDGESIAKHDILLY